MFNLLQPVLDSLGREVALISLGLGEQALLAAVLLVQFLDRAGGILGCDFKLFQRRLLLCKVPGDDERWRDQFGLQLFFTDRQIRLFGELAFTVPHEFADLPRSGPAVLREHMNVVLHDLGPIGHEMLIDGIVVDESDLGEAEE